MNTQTISQGVKEEDLIKLSEPFPVKWKPNNFSGDKSKVQCVGYIDARAVQKRLDAVCGMSNWKSILKEMNGNIYCQINIRVNGEWISRMDVGKESKMEPEKGQASDALKRAAVHWGIGRFLYDLPMMWLKTVNKGNKFYPVDDKGNILYNEGLTKYLNRKVDIEWRKEEKPQPSYDSGLLTEYASVVLDYIPTIQSSKTLEALWRKIPSLTEDIDIINEMSTHGGMLRKEKK